MWILWCCFILIQHCIQSKALLSKRNATNQTSWELSQWNVSKQRFEPLLEATHDLPGYLLVTDRRPMNDAKLSIDDDPDEGARKIFNGLVKVLGRPGVVTQIPDSHKLETLSAITCPGGCSSNENCAYLYDTFFRYSPDPRADNPFSWSIEALPRLSSVANSSRDASQPQNFQCLFKASNESEATVDDGALETRGCSFRPDEGDGYLEVWRPYGVDAHMHALVNGGLDSDGIWWLRYNKSSSLLSQIGAALLDNPDFSCSLETPCSERLDCNSIGSRTALDLGQDGNVFRVRWGYLALLAIQNINLQLRNQWVNLQGSTIQSTLVAFNIETFFPEPNAHFGLLKAIEGIGTIFAAVAGFIPAFSAGLGAAGAIIPAVGSAVEGVLAKTAATQKDFPTKFFASEILNLYPNLTASLDDFAAALFSGSAINGTETNSNITEMMRGGYWVNKDALTPVKEAQRQLATEIISRGINSLWKISPGKKIWVLYIDLGDGANSTVQCKMHTKGPQDSKYCADHGVYYLYNFKDRVLDYPWGMPDNLNLIDSDMTLSWITQASASTYQFAKNASRNIDPFNVNSSSVSNAFLQSLFANDDFTGLNPAQYYGRFPGTWTVPVCNASTWGKDWNWDYTKGTDKGSHPPCLCGDKGTETARWVEAAGMKDDNAYYERCQQALGRVSKFEWPEGVDQVDFGFRSPIRRGSSGMQDVD